jgi:hypothetical protein
MQHSSHGLAEGLGVRMGIKIHEFISLQRSFRIMS